jgi:poly-gamma-glutamate synthesis protein (capsule biosynthesis protein)
MQALARELIEMGADFYWGHSNHTPQGLEFYKGKAILYSAGDFIDDYAIDKEERNDLSFLFVLELDGTQLARIRLYPTCIEDLGVWLAKDQEWRFLARTMQAKCKALGSTMELAERTGTITLR